MREAEHRAALGTSLMLDTSGPKPAVHWPSPVSKEDCRALGMARTLGCSCGDIPDGWRPARSFWDQLLDLRTRFPESFT